MDWALLITAAGQAVWRILPAFPSTRCPDRITLQEDELSEGAWFDRAHLPDVPPGGSLTGEMIELFRQGREP